MVSIPRPRRPSAQPAARGEAADWIAALQRPDRGQQVESDFRAWLDYAPENPGVFDAATQIWELLGAAGQAFRSERRRKVVKRAALTASAACLIVLVGVGAGAVSQAAKRRKLSAA